MFINGDGNLVLYIPFILFAVLTVFSLKGLSKMRNREGVGIPHDTQYRRYKIFLLLNGIILLIIYIVGIVSGTFSI